MVRFFFFSGGENGKMIDEDFDTISDAKITNRSEDFIFSPLINT